MASQADFASGTVRFTGSTANTAATPPNDLARRRLLVAGPRVRRGQRRQRAGPRPAPSARPLRTRPSLARRRPMPRSTTLASHWSSRGTPSPAAKTYEVQIDDDPAFVGAPAPVSTSNTSYTPVTPPFGTPSSTGACAAKLLAGRPDAVLRPALLLDGVEGHQRPAQRRPAEAVSPLTTAATTIEEVVLDWNPLRGASCLRAPDQPGPVLQRPDRRHRSWSTARATPPALRSRRFVLLARARPQHGRRPEPSPWSEHLDVHPRMARHDGLRRAHDGTADNRHAQVTLTAPADGDYITDTEPVFSWNPQREASMYELSIGTDPSFSPTTYPTCLTNHTVFTPYRRAVQPHTARFSKLVAGPGALLARARPRRPHVIDAESRRPRRCTAQVRSFLYDPAFVQQISPPSGSVGRRSRPALGRPSTTSATTRSRSSLSPP